MTDIDSVRGRALDQLVAERIMGARLDAHQKAADGSPLVLQELPRFTENPAMARGIEFTLDQRHPGTSMRYEAQSPYKIVIRGPSGREYAGTDDDEATAICRAMVKTMEGEGPGIPREQNRTDRSPRALSTAAELLAAKAQPHQAIGIMMQAIALQQSDRKEGAARAFLLYAASAKEIVPPLAEQMANKDSMVAGLCVAALERLVLAGDAAREALARKTP
jgi:hypothetical protein